MIQVNLSPDYFTIIENKNVGPKGGPISYNIVLKVQTLTNLVPGILQCSELGFPWEGLVRRTT